MVRAIIQYESEPDPERYRRHVDEYVPLSSCSASRRGRVLGSPEVAASGRDAMALGIPFTVHFVEVE